MHSLPQGGVRPQDSSSIAGGHGGRMARQAMKDPNAAPPQGSQLGPCNGRFPGQGDAAADDGYSDSGSSSLGSKPDEKGHQRRVRRRRRTAHGTSHRHGSHHRVVRRRRRHRSRSRHLGGEVGAAPIGGGAPPKRRASPPRAGPIGADTVPLPGKFGSGNHQADVDGFIQKNVLEARVAHALRTLSEEQQKKVMGTDGGQNSFLLVGRVDNPNGVVMSRIRKVESGG